MNKKRRWDRIVFENEREWSENNDNNENNQAIEKRYTLNTDSEWIEYEQKKHAHENIRQQFEENEKFKKN